MKSRRHLLFLKSKSLSNFFRKGVSLVGLALIPSCGYQVEEGALASQYKTLSVPYFVGDDQGLLTDAVVKALSFSSSFQYAQKGGELTLEGTIIHDGVDFIGYQYDRDPTSGERKNRLIPNEGRREVTVRISLVNTQSQEVLYGPFDVKASSDFDFIDSDSLQDATFIGPSGLRQSVLFFSLGQLDSMEGAQDVALHPLYRRLALKIAEGIENIPHNVNLSD